MNICLFSEEELSRPLAKHDERAQHIVKILHKKPGDTFTAGIIGGMAGTATIRQIIPKGQDGEGNILFTFQPQKEGKPLYPLTLIVGFPRPIQLRRLLRDVAGLGAKRIILTGTELGEKSYMESTVVEKNSAYRMLLDGTAQAGGTHVPELITCATLNETISTLNSAVSTERGEARICLDNKKPEYSLHDFLYKAAEPTKEVIAAIGSERGWTDKEREIFSKAGFTHCGMGSRILRTETAATTAAAVILDSMGFLN